jgi:hypothetical protein
MRTEVPFDHTGEAHRSSDVHLSRPMIRARGCDTTWFLDEPGVQLRDGHSLPWG